MKDEGLKSAGLSFNSSSLIPPLSSLMSYQVIARKWRPQKFEDVTGQEILTRTLRNAIEHGRLHHAYLFSGARGGGKTTTARLVAKALNCHKAAGPTPPPSATPDETAFPSSPDLPPRLSPHHPQ